MVWSDSLAPQPLALAPRFVNNDYVTVEIICSLHLQVMKYSLGQGMCSMHICKLHLESGDIWPLGPSCACWVSQRRILLQLLGQPGENKRVCSACGSWVFFQPLNSRLAYAGFKEQCEQCEQQDNWPHKQDQQNSKMQLKTSLVVQRLRVCARKAGGPDSILGQGTRFHMPQLRPSTTK